MAREVACRGVLLVLLLAQASPAGGSFAAAVALPPVPRSPTSCCSAAPRCDDAATCASCLLPQSTTSCTRALPPACMQMHHHGPHCMAHFAIPAGLRHGAAGGGPHAAVILPRQALPAAQTRSNAAAAASQKQWAAALRSRRTLVAHPPTHALPGSTIARKAPQCARSVHSSRSGMALVASPRPCCTIGQPAGQQQPVYLLT